MARAPLHSSDDASRADRVAPRPAHSGDAVFTRPWIIRFPLYRRIKEDMRLLEFKYLDLNPSTVLSQTCSTTSLPLVDPVGSPHDALETTQEAAHQGGPHGFRSSFRDWAAERMNCPREVVEAALAHVVSNATEAAYVRSDLFERRRRLMHDLGSVPQRRTG